MHYFRFIIAVCLVTISLCSSGEAGPLTDQAKSIYKQHHNAVFQIRVVSHETGEKAALGSGFQFTPDGYVATNYHVVSDAALFPNLYSIEYVTFDDRKGKAALVNIDPVHDIAILKADQTFKPYLELGDSSLDKGTKIFSFGNPYDLGMTIVEGLYNGLMERSMYRKILFSGSLNPGMSGGPALGADGKIIGVNVSTAGDQISFFVPVEYLKGLAAELQQNKNLILDGGWQKVIRDRLVMNQDQFVDELVAQETWTKRQIGRALVPGEISDEFKCWGQSSDNREYWMKYAYSTCSTEDVVFISSTMFTGQFAFRYTWLESREFNPFRFYNLFQKHVGEDDLYYFENAAERDAENFSCKNSFVRIDGKVFQSSFCARAYDDYEGIYDLNLKLSSVAFYSDALAIDIIALGVTQQQTEKFLERFLKEIKWQE